MRQAFTKSRVTENTKSPPNMLCPNEAMVAWLIEGSRARTVSSGTKPLDAISLFGALLKNDKRATERERENDIRSLLVEWFGQEQDSSSEVAALLKPFTDKLTDIQFVRSDLRAWEEQFRLLEGLDAFRVAHGRLTSSGARGGARAPADGARALQSKINSMEAVAHEQGDAADLIEDQARLIARRLYSAPGAGSTGLIFRK